MRAATGFVFVNGWLVVVGLSVLRALGMLAPRRGAAVAALGPGLLAGATTVVPLLIATLVAGVPLTPLTVLAVGVVVIALARTAARWRGREGLNAEPTGSGRVAAVVAALSLAYALAGGVAFARAPTIGDDARIWSLRGLTLTYFHRLQPEVFLSHTASLGHPVYPLFQPVLEAVVAGAMGAPQLRIDHSELWLLTIAALWTAAFLIAHRAGVAASRSPYWLAPLGLIALTPFVLHNVYLGDADVTGAALFGVAIASLALFVETGGSAHLALGAALLVAAASTKDEEYLAAAPVLVVLLLTLQLGRSWRHGAEVRAPWHSWLAAVAFVVCVAAPWRVWVAAHHLTDPVTPRLPQALSPTWLLNRHDLGAVGRAMLRQVLDRWGWLAVVFLATCVVCLLTRTVVRVTLFYLGGVLCTAAVLAWAYIATPQPLFYLVPTSMYRTVAVFMVPAGFATAHLLAALLDAGGSPALSGVAWWRSSRTVSRP